MKIWAWAAAVGSVATLVACGGGGGGTGGGGTGGTSPTSSSSSSTSTSTSSSSTSTSTSSSGSMGCGAFTFSTDATCETCTETNCCAELTACDTGTACNDLFACIGACATGDTACQQQCVTDHMDGAADGQALIDCNKNSCTTECTTPGTICDSGLVNSNNTACGDCAGQQCCTEFDACVADATCKDCITGASTTGCDTNAPLAAVQSCQMSKCSDTCGALICDSGLTTSNGKCDTCLGTNCCQVVKDCHNDTACFNNCLSAAMPAASCATDTKYQAVKTCWNTSCAGANDCGGML